MGKEAVRMLLCKYTSRRFSRRNRGVRTCSARDADGKETDDDDEAENECDGERSDERWAYCIVSFLDTLSLEGNCYETLLQLRGIKSAACGCDLITWSQLNNMAVDLIGTRNEIQYFFSFIKKQLF